MALSSAELEFESGAVLPARDTMLTVNLSLVTSRISANSAFLSLVNKAGRQLGERSSRGRP